MKVLLTGATGFLGSMLINNLQHQYDFIGLSSKQLDLSKPSLVADYLQQFDFDLCLHFAALTQTAQCEQEPELTHRVNVESTIEIAKVCHQRGKRMVFLSTEQVFNAQSGAPFTETDQPKSSTIYGQQKIEAENYIINNLDDYVILRLTWQMGLGSPGIKESPNLIRQVLNTMIKQQPTMFTLHEIRGFTYAYHLVKDFPLLLTVKPGIYHFASQNTLNTYECAVAIAKKLGLNPEAIEQLILPNLTRYQDAPRDYRLSNDKARSFGFSPNNSIEDIEQCLKDFGY
jgi:dTDP-4-dehydrorhamnose reductase